MKSKWNGLKSGNVIDIEVNHFIGYDQYIFNPVLVSLLDRIFFYGNYNILNRKQNEFINSYLVEAHKKTEDKDYVISDVFHQFDNFLGSVK